MTGFERTEPPNTGTVPLTERAPTGYRPIGETVRESVGAVVVTHGHTPYLERTLAALHAGPRPREIVVVDTGATAEVARFDDLHLGQARFVPAPGARSFGQAVDAALAHLGPVTWLWLLHDDSAPEPDALAQLVQMVEQFDTITIAGVKQRPWDAVESGDERVLEVGMTTTTMWRRVTGVGPFDIDQGQLDDRDDVLAVGLAGALVRRAAWEQLGGTDPELGPYGDGLDFCIRARRAGGRVVVVPGAVVRHAQASLNGLRRSPERGPHRQVSFGARRRAALHLRLTSVSPVMLPLAALAMLLWGPLVAMSRLVTKQPRHARDEILAPLWVLSRFPTVLRARRAAARTSVLSRREMRWGFVLPARYGLAERRERRAAYRIRALGPHRPTDAELAELRGRARVRRAVLLAVLGALVAYTAVLFAPLWGPLSSGGRPVGGALLAVSTSLADMWRSASTGWIATGLGHGAPADPLTWFLLAVAVLAGGSAQTAVNAVVVGGFLAAGMGAWFAAGALHRSPAVRAWAALMWAAAPAFTAGLFTGRPGALIAHAALPWLALAIIRAVGAQRVDEITTPVPEARSVRTQRHPASLGAAAAAGLCLVVVTAGAPVLLPVACILLGIAALMSARQWHYLAAIPLPAVVLFAPFFVHTARTASSGGWQILFAEPGAPTASTPARPWQLLLGFPQTPGPWWGASSDGVLGILARGGPYVAAVLLVATGVLAVARARRAAVLGWAVIASGVAVAVVAQATVVAPGAVRGWAGPGTSLAYLGLLGTAVALAPGTRVTSTSASRQKRRGFRRWGGRIPAAILGVVVMLCILGPAVNLGAWTARALDREGAQLGDVAVSNAPYVPPVGQLMQGPPREGTILVLSPADDGVIEYSLLRADGAQLVDASAVLHHAELDDPGLAQGALPPIVAGLVAGSDPQASDRLGERGVAAVLLPAGEQTGPRAALAARLDMVSGLERITEGQSSALWRIATDTEPSWAQTVEGTRRTVVPADGLSVDTAVGTGAANRMLVLAANPASRWHATLDGRPLEPTKVNGLQAFQLGPHGGHLRVSYAMNHRWPWLITAGGVLLGYGLVSIPLRRHRLDQGAL